MTWSFWLFFAVLQRKQPSQGAITTNPSPQFKETA
jgi:hypothetical protein